MSAEQILPWINLLLWMKVILNNQTFDTLYILYILFFVFWFQFQNFCRRTSTHTHVVWFSAIIAKSNLQKKSKIPAILWLDVQQTRIFMSSFCSTTSHYLLWEWWKKPCNQTDDKHSDRLWKFLFFKCFQSISFQVNKNFYSIL